MELVSLGLEALQSAVEYAASYRPGQSLLRLLDRGLWVVEKCARWAVPPPLDQDERPPPQLVRPLPWVFFLMMLVALRVAREFISLANLVMGKPPLRSADVVVFIQSKRRYLRTLKYQGSRIMRARTSTPPQQPWYHGLNSLFELTMCFRRQSQHYGNNNTTRVTNNDEVVVIKRTKRGRADSSPVTSSESTMERLIEKMMVDLDAESDEDSLTITNVTSPKPDRSECTESDQDTICEVSTPTPSQDTEISQTNGDDIHFSPDKNQNASSTPEKEENHKIENDTGNHTLQISDLDDDADKTVIGNSITENGGEKLKPEVEVTESWYTEISHENTESNSEQIFEDAKACEDSALPALEEETLSPSQLTANFIKNEAAAQNFRRTKKDYKIGNGRTVKSTPSKKKGANHQRANSNEVLQQRVLPSNNSF